MATKRSENWQGMKWCRPTTRLAIYLRDGLACVYCGASVEEGTILTLDHVVPHSKGGSNAPSNLVTCCKRCNSSRGVRSVPVFAAAVAEYVNHGETADAIILRVRAAVRRVLPRDLARDMIRRRGTVARAVAHAR